METKNEVKKTTFTHGQVVRAHAALGKLYNQNIPSDVAYDVYNMMQETEKIDRFHREQRMKILEEMKPEETDGGATLSFGTPERLQEYKDRIKKLEEMPADIEITPTTLQLSPRLIIAPADIPVLKGFVNLVK